MALPQMVEHYTFDDYMSWTENARCELIDGLVYMMSPAPGRLHQKASGGLFTQIFDFLKGKPCEVYAAPFDVRIDPHGSDDTVVQPDITVICDESILTDHGASGTPTLVMEIISPSSARIDRIAKLEVYRRAGVPEYWIVDPDRQTVEVHLLKDGEYVVRAYAKEEPVPVAQLPGLSIDLNEVFAPLRVLKQD